MPRISPIQRISFAIVMLTVSLLVFSDLIGLMPNKHTAALELRKQVSEALAIQLSQLAGAKQFHLLQSTLHSVVSRNGDILSAALRRNDGESVSEYGDHARHWGKHQGNKSTLTHVLVPIFQGSQRWGVVEIRFADLYGGSVQGYLQHSLIGLIAFIALAGYLSYLLFLRRALRSLDPSSVIPDRVRSAFDLMAEGIAILDEKGQLVLANTALADRLQTTPKALMGKDLARMNWRERGNSAPYPWEESRRNKTRVTGVPLVLEPVGENPEHTIFTVNSAPILDTKNIQRGVFVTFDDMTVLEKKNDELSNALDQLTQSKAEIVRQNKELQYIATRDPMTGALNRRALFDGFNRLLDQALEDQTPLSAMMIDIDHFKSVNDNYGHAVGDEVIKLVARILHEQTREQDLVGRYGGEEFVVAMPDADLDAAEQIAERIRQTILQESQTDACPVERLTASLGVSLLSEQIDTPDALIDLADQALYQAKTGGRNRVVRADQLREDGAPKEEAEPAPKTEQEQLLEKISELKQLASNRKAELEQGRLYDAETGLPNRNLLRTRIDELIARHRRHGGYGAVVLLYINAYEKVVNAYGYQAAGEFINNVARQLAGHLRVTDAVTRDAGESSGEVDFYRIGSAEIGVLLTDLDTKANVIKVLARLSRLLEDAIEIQDTAFLPNAELGIALYPVDGNDAESLLRNASAARDLADQQAQEHGFRFYSNHMNEFAREQLSTESELKNALENDQLELWYQPKFAQASDAITGLEALLRWRHPQRGIIYPDKFIPIAEQSDLIKHIGNWVLQAAFAQLQEWQHSPSAQLRIAINVSPQQFLDNEFLAQFEVLAAQNPHALGLLDLELTEGVLLKDPQATRTQLDKLATFGINVYLDDFGTGYSSLSYLKDLPLHGLKIDRSFTQDVAASKQERAIVRSIVLVAEELGLDLIAEGIETGEQLEAMAGLGCREFQGYYFGRPLPIEQIVPLIDQTRAASL